MARPLLPTAYVNFKDGQLPKGPLPSGLFVFIGVGDGSAANGVATPINSPNDIQILFGTGPLARDLVTAFLGGIGFCYAIQLPSSTAGAIGTPSLGGFTEGALGGTVKNAYDVRVKPYLAGPLGVAQVQYSLDGGRTWGEPRVLKSGAGANAVVGPDNFAPGLTFTTTLADVALTTGQFSCATVAPTASTSEIKAAMDTAIQDASLFFSGFHVSAQLPYVDDLISFASDVQAKLDDAATTWAKFLYAELQASLDVTTGASALTAAQAIRAGFAGNRVQIAIQPLVLKSLGGQYVMNCSPLVVARRAQLEPQNDLGIVRAGQLLPVGGFAPGWTDGSITGIDQLRNCVTVRRHVGIAGFYFTNDWMTDPSSDYRKSCLRIVADLVAADIRVAGMPHVKMDIDPLDVSGSAEILLAACRGPLSIRKNNRQFSQYELSVPEGQDILTTEELVVEVAIVPMGTASWIKFNVGFKNPIAGG